MTASGNKHVSSILCCQVILLLPDKRGLPTLVYFSLAVVCCFYHHILLGFYFNNFHENYYISLTLKQRVFVLAKLYLLRTHVQSSIAGVSACVKSHIIPDLDWEK